MDPTLVTEMVKQYGFPIVSSVGMGYFVYFIYTFVTTKLMPIIGETNTILVALIDRIRMLDNDMIRLQQKVNVILQMREEGTINANQDKTGSIKTPKP
jgi:hypothetical protein